MLAALARLSVRPAAPPCSLRSPCPVLLRGPRRDALLRSLRSPRSLRSLRSPHSLRSPRPVLLRGPRRDALLRLRAAVVVGVGVDRRLLRRPGRSLEQLSQRAAPAAGSSGRLTRSRSGSGGGGGGGLGGGGGSGSAALVPSPALLGAATGHRADGAPRRLLALPSLKLAAGRVG